MYYVKDRFAPDKHLRTRHDPGVAEGCMTVAPLPNGLTTGRGQRPKRSPKGRSASPGTRPGVASSGRPRGGGQINLEGPKRRGGSDRHGQRRAEGTSLGDCRGWSSYALAPGLTNRHWAVFSSERTLTRRLSIGSESSPASPRSGSRYIRIRTTRAGPSRASSPGRCATVSSTGSRRGRSGWRSIGTGCGTGRWARTRKAARQDLPI